MYYDLTGDRRNEEDDVVVMAPLDTSQLSSMWQILHEGDDRPSASSDMSDPQESAKSSISLSKLLTLQHRRSNLLPQSPSPLTSSSSVSPVTSTELQSPYLDVQSMLRKLSSLADSKEVSGDNENDDSGYENEDDDTEELQLQALEPKVVANASSISIATLPQAPTPTQAPLALTTTYTAPTALHQQASPLPKPVPLSAAPMAKRAPLNPLPSAPKRAIFGTRLAKSSAAAPLKLPSASPQKASQLPSPPPTPGSPKMKRSVTAGHASAFASSQSQPSSGLVKTLSEPKLSQSSQPGPKSASDVLDWLEDAGFSYEDFVSVDTTKEPRQSPAAHSTANSNNASAHFFEEQGEDHSDSSQSSRPATQATAEIVEKDISFAEFAFDEEALEAQIAEIEKFRALKADDEEDEETALTTSRYRRFLVLEVSDGEDEDVRLRAIDAASNSEHFISLRDDWRTLDIQIGDIINVVGRIEPQGSAYTYIVDHQRNLVILHPDVLVFGTLLAQSSECERRSIINYCVKTPPRVDIQPEVDIENASTIASRPASAAAPSLQATNAALASSTNVPLDKIPQEKNMDPRLALYGIFVHELFQFAVDNLDFTSASLDSYVNTLVIQHLIEIFASGDTEEKVRTVLKGWIPSIVNWAQRFFPTALTDSRIAASKASSLPASSASRFKTANNDNTIEIGDKKYTLRVVKALDVEEHVVSIMYGLKGDIDGTLVIELQPVMPRGSAPQPRELTSPNKPSSAALTSDYNAAKSLMIPLEVKSGNLNVSFTLQVILYALLLADRYHRDIPLALLFSIKENNMVALEVSRRQVIFAIEKRNRIATFLNRRYRLPPVLQRPSTCTDCYQADACMTLHRAFEHGTAKSSGLDDANFARFSDGLKSHKHAQFLSHWFNLIDLEQIEVERYRQQNWTLPKKEREKLGRTISGLRLVAVSHSRPDLHPIALLSQKSTQGPTQSQRLGSQHAKQTIATGKRLLYLTFERWPAQINQEEPHVNDSVSLPTSPLKRKTKTVDLDNLIFSPDFSQRSRSIKLTDLQFSVGDHVILSEGRHFSLTTCTVVEVTAHSLVLSCNRASLRLPPRETGVMLPTSQRWTPLQSKMKRDNFAVDLEALGATCMPSQSQDFLHSDFENKDLARIRYRIDREEQQAGFNALKGNVLQLFRNTHWARKYRSLFVDLRAPRFRDENITHAETEKLKLHSFSLNGDQLQAINQVLSARDYALILGMPGTGKTTTVAALAAILVWRGKTVLLSAATHSAVDGLLLQLLKLEVQFLRLGHPDLVNPAVRHATLSSLEDATSVARLTELVGPGSPRYAVVAATCLGVNHLLLQSRSFDYCIVDETSQATFPVILGPMRLASIGVFIGDLYQLPPIVKSPQAVAAGLQEETIFKMLAAAHPSAKLRIQYRMNENIMKLSNNLIYQGMLRCGNENVAKRKFEFSDSQYMDMRSLLDLKRVEAYADPKLRTRTWLEEILDHNRQVIFVNTDFVPAPEEKLELADVVRNPTEAQLVAILAKALLRIGVERESLGIISPLRAQLKQIHLALATALNPQAPTHRTLFNNVHTVDKYQGADIDCVIVSFVRSNPLRSVGTLLKDWRRINVAFTRAKKKLIIIGSRSTLSSNHLLSAFFELVDQHGFMFNLPPNASKAILG